MPVFAPCMTNIAYKTLHKVCALGTAPLDELDDPDVCLI